MWRLVAHKLKNAIDGIVGAAALVLVIWFIGLFTATVIALVAEVIHNLWI